MARPVQGGSNGTWGTELNAWLDVSLESDGTLRLPVAVGTGDNVAYYQDGVGRRAVVKDGTTGAPVTSGAGPTLKINRTEQVLESAMPGGIGANNQGNAALWVAAKGSASTEAQVAAGLFTAESGSTQSAHNDDACGIVSLASVTGTGTGIGIGGYFEGRRDTATGNAAGLEVAVRNWTNTAGFYNSAGLSNTTGLWLVSRAGNTATLNGVAIAVGNSDGVQFDVGLAFTSQGTGGPILSSSIRDDSSSATALDIRGTHATAALQIASGSGHVGIGIAADSASLVKLQSEAAGNPAMAVYAHASQSVNVFQVVSSAGTEWFSIGSTGNIRLIDKNIVFGTTTGTQIGTTNAQKLAFWAATPAAQQVFATGTGKTVDNVITLLQSIGLCRQT